MNAEITEQTIPKGCFAVFGWTYFQGLSLADMGVYGLLGIFSSYNAEINSYSCNKPLAELAQVGGCSTMTIRRSLARLVKAGLVERREQYAEDGTRLPNEYKIVATTFAY